MSAFLVTVVVIAVIYCTISWVLPKIIAWTFERKYNVDLRIGRIGLPYFKLCDVNLCKNGFTIHIEEISINSSFFNSEVTKLVTLVVKDVRINKDVGTHQQEQIVPVAQSRGNPMDFRNKKIPRFITTFAQFMAIHVYNISANLLHSESPGWLLHATASELHLDGSIVQNSRTLLVNVNMSEASARVLRHSDNKKSNYETCLGELSFAISLEATLVAQGPLSFEKLSIIMSQTSAMISDDFYTLFQRKQSKECSPRVTHVSDCNDNDLMLRLAPVVPKSFLIRIQETKLRGMRENSRTEFRSSLKSLQINFRFNSVSQVGDLHLPNLFFSFKLDTLHLHNNRKQLLYMSQFKLDAKFDSNVVDLYICMNTLRLTYDHKSIHKWISMNFLQNKGTSMVAEVSEEQVMVVAAAGGRSVLERLASIYAVNGCAEFIGISFTIKLNSGYNSVVGFNLVKLILNQFKDKRASSYSKYLPRLLLGNRHWQMEVLMECLWWSFNDEWTRGSIKSHIWDTPLYLDMALIKFGTHDKNETKIESLLDTLQLEWSKYLVSYMIMVIQCLKQYRINPGATKKRVQRSEEHNLKNLNVKLTLHNFNGFLLTQTKEYLVVRLDEISLEKRRKCSKVHLNNFKVLSVLKRNTFYNCVRCDEIPTYKVFVKSAIIEDDVAISVQLLERIVVYWSTPIHLKLLFLFRDIKEFSLVLVESFGSRIATTQQKQQHEMPSKEKRTFSVNICGLLSFHIHISQRHNAKIELQNLLLVKAPMEMALTNTGTVISIDDAEVFTLQGIQVRPINADEDIVSERMENESFELPWNRTWGVNIDSFKAIFPYDLNFSDAIQNEFVSIFKWLKIVHGKQKVPFTKDSPLPGDLLINVKEFLFELSDDPFEVKLRDNFELLEDEYNESLKRKKKLADKVDELTKKHLHLPAGKVEELYANLKQKNAEIYIQRSKQLLLTSPPRTRLFAWSMTNVEIMVLADPSIHGTENVVNAMQRIDPESPWPEEGIEFSILWCRAVSMRCEEWKFQLRDFLQPLMLIRHWYICGQLVGAEQSAPRRAKRDVVVELDDQFETPTIERSLLPLKFYHDFNCEIESFSYAFGPCWEPVIAQCNLSFENISAPSRDPSPPLPFWDKMRMLFHGRLTMEVQQLTVLLHASLDPYNTTEEMELTWSHVIMDWTNAKFVFKGDFGIFVRTASKYDDCHLMQLPNIKLIVNIQWVCLGDPNDHHNVIQCAPDKIPEYSSNQVHDSFRAFRSQNVNLSLTLETRPVQVPSNVESPMLSLYGSTLRWFENLKLILSGVTRPTRRGRIFNNIRPRKIQLSRHYKKIHLLIGLHKFQVCYWMSFAMQRGCELLGGRVSSSSEHILSLNPIDDGLKHRPKAEWSIMYMNSELNDSEIWLKSALTECDTEPMTLRQPVEKCYCLSVAKVSYGRETVLPNRELGDRNKDTPTHRLVVYDLKGAWTKSNRNVALALFDTFMKNKQMKKNLSTEALKGFRKEANTTPLKRRNTEGPGTPPNASTIQSLQTQSVVQEAPSPLTRIQSGHAANMLQQLIAEAENKAVVFSDDLSSATRQQHLQGLQACQEDDVQHKNWNITLVNAQMLLKGCETKGYVILSAAKAEILQRIHRPVWKERTLVSKTTWVGTLECLQYYATVSAGENDTINDNIMWLTVDNIQEKESSTNFPDVLAPHMVGSGVSVGAVVSDTVGAPNVGDDGPIQLQRIVSRCKCEFFYAGYGDISVDPGAVGEVPPPPQEDVGLWDRRQTAVNAFTLMHHDLDVCTNSLQYAMLLDVVNNLLLYVDSQRKEALEKLARMRFQLQLQSAEDQRKPIQNLQTKVRSLLSRLRRLEKETYLLHKARVEDAGSSDLVTEIEKLENSVHECKTELNTQAEKLDMMLSCYKESQLLATNRLATTRNDKPLSIVRANEICFKHAQWRLTEADGQIGIADLVLSNFLYTKNSKSDDSVEHLLELGYVRMTNLLPNQIYKEVLLPTEIKGNMPVEHKRVVRVFCREKPPVGGISVKEHFEINVVPLTIGLTKKFYNMMLKFCFPERDPDNIEGDQRAGDEIEEAAVAPRGKKNRGSGKRNRDSSFYVHIDDVEKMKERAEKNKLFIYIKIPEVPVRLSYKGTKEKNLEDIRDFSLVIPTLEYHNVTWTWLDLLMAIRSDSRKVILSQAIKQKLQLKRNIGSSDESSSPQEEDKARMLFGASHASSDSKSIKKGVFKFGK
ncbi:PREDICTED: protein KIAA0100 [Nicrophorus vespilloides]|uniref:Protein KIAA0100 n=1 Tax=Nicrophorus vespilloides TaxID=110193 RepID=A0ABM1N428_NICVS|nr:PREDICTED: protein KIAA0100 [Nicrophorus vespilloides]